MLGLGVFVDIDKTENNATKIVIGFLTILSAHGIESVDKRGKIITIKSDFHGKPLSKQ